jgi:hypothetical protein
MISTPLELSAFRSVKASPVGLIVGLESLGLPLPGETILILAAIYAATEPRFNIWMVIAVAAFGAIIGDNIGYWLGSRYGYALLLRYGERIGRLSSHSRFGWIQFDLLPRPILRVGKARGVANSVEVPGLEVDGGDTRRVARDDVDSAAVTGIKDRAD